MFTSEALTRIIQTGSPGNILNSIAVPANQQIFYANARLSGGVSCYYYTFLFFCDSTNICVGFFLEGCASVFIQVLHFFFVIYFSYE